jgi:hypothetical protein
MQPVAVQQVVHTVNLPPDEIVFVVQVIAIAVVANSVAIMTNIVFMLFPCLNDKTA